MAEDYWNTFVEPGIGEAIRFGLFQWMCDECHRTNPYVLYSIVGVCDQIILSIEQKTLTPVLIPFIKKIQISKQLTPQASAFYINCFETLRDQALAELQNHFTLELQNLDTKLDIRYVGVLAAVKKSLIVIEYMTKGLCSTIERAEKAWDNTLIQDSLMERLISWL